MNKKMLTNNIYNHNQIAWNKMAKEQSPWSQPVSSEIIAEARAGRFNLPLLPTKIPSGWLPDQVQGMSILCLAASGGQQAPILAAAGADVVVFDASPEQLALDELVAKRECLELKTICGDMRDLSTFSDESFDLIIHPVSNLYVPDINIVWDECFRVLKYGGRLLSSFYNPVAFVFDRDPYLKEKGITRPCYKLPYSDMKDLEPDLLEDKKINSIPLVFGHTLNDQIGGQLDAGFIINGFNESFHPNPRFLIEEYVPVLIATCSLKVKSMSL
ncbi:hypothetical protein AZ021_004523 [Enterobacter ludwigii]|uniref:class I SAM-dependent methyltransferase n=1 Tax=Enterobacter ludwigii TaxID=299767 RepID=UPI000B68B316|nr:class I SAM-dependent methyltransferase [Enterobacter ludwigii]ELK6460644.1 class I SAM-dependent methyltransferase [Enterobacter ludwigii]OUF04858.1 hypothetical protein AZ021_004523 [Enterobacter ludwigii]HDT1289576.1 class I SAM-dependent methyltransferase [Enterobacter asburiae]